jgi:hypothetical protein
MGGILGAAAAAGAAEGTAAAAAESSALNPTLWDWAKYMVSSTPDYANQGVHIMEATAQGYPGTEKNTPVNFWDALLNTFKGGDNTPSRHFQAPYPNSLTSTSSGVENLFDKTPEIKQTSATEAPKMKTPAEYAELMNNLLSVFIALSARR